VGPGGPVDPGSPFGPGGPLYFFLGQLISIICGVRSFFHLFKYGNILFFRLRWSFSGICHDFNSLTVIKRRSIVLMT
jgi:hypothetical protein